MHTFDMKNFPKRTGGTNLSNDELLLLDFLAINGDCNINLLKKDSYPLHMNCSYTHDISDNKIENKIEELFLKGWINKRVGDVLDIGFDTQNEKYNFTKSQGYIYSITEEGGGLWEVERAPIWERYCTDSSYPDEVDENIYYFELNCLKKDVGLQFAKCMVDCGLYKYAFGKLKPTNPDPYFVPWKKFEKVYAMKAQLIDSDRSDADWDCYERSRNWWRDLRELQKFLA